MAMPRRNGPFIQSHTSADICDSVAGEKEDTMTLSGRQPIDKGHFDIRIAPDGAWYHEGTRITRFELVKLFASVLKRDGDDYLLETPAEKGRITVDDAPFVAVEMSVRGSGADQVLCFRTNLDEEVEAGVEHAIRIETDAQTGEPRPYIHIRDGLEARILRSVFYDMAALAVAEQSGAVPAVMGVWSRGQFFRLL